MHDDGTGDTIPKIQLLVDPDAEKTGGGGELAMGGGEHGEPAAETVAERRDPGLAAPPAAGDRVHGTHMRDNGRSEEHTSELQSH